MAQAFTVLHLQVSDSKRVLIKISRWSGPPLVDSLDVTFLCSKLVLVFSPLFKNIIIVMTEFIIHFLPRLFYFICHYTLVHCLWAKISMMALLTNSYLVKHVDDWSRFPEINKTYSKKIKILSSCRLILKRKRSIIWKRIRVHRRVQPTINLIPAPSRACKTILSDSCNLEFSTSESIKNVAFWT